MASLLNLSKHILKLDGAGRQQLHLVSFIKRNAHLPEVSNGTFVSTLGIASQQTNNKNKEKKKLTFYHLPTKGQL